MKIRFWPHTCDSNVASFRIRCEYVARGLSSRGIDAKIVDRAESCDVLVLSKRYDVESIRQAVELRDATRTEIFLDICDNHFHARISNDWSMNRASHLKRALETVDSVVASSEYLADEIRSHAQLRFEPAVIPDIIEQPKFPQLKQRLAHPIDELLLLDLEWRLARQTPRRASRLVWFGNRGGGSAEGGIGDLARIRNDLEMLHAASPISLTVISNSWRQYWRTCGSWKLPTNYLPWARNTVSRALKLHGISLIPVTPNAFTLAKTANRVTTSIMHGLAVVADRIPSYDTYADSIAIDKWDSELPKLVNDATYWRRRVQEASNRLDPVVHNERILDAWEAALTGCRPSLRFEQ